MFVFFTLDLCSLGLNCLVVFFGFVSPVGLEILFVASLFWRGRRLNSRRGNSKMELRLLPSQKKELPWTLKITNEKKSKNTSFGAPYLHDTLRLKFAIRCFRAVFFDRGNTF